MKIYQVHEHSGQHEDYMDRIVGSYVDKDRAIDYKKRLEKVTNDKRELYEKCQSCNEEYSKCCSDSLFVTDEYDEVVCFHEYRYDEELDNTYEVKEVNVVEGGIK